MDHVRLTATGATPHRMMKIEETLLGQKPSEGIIHDAVRAVMEGLEQDSDIHASAEYRRSVCEAMGERTLLEAAKRANQLSKGRTQ